MDIVRADLVQQPEAKIMGNEIRVIYCTLIIISSKSEVENNRKTTTIQENKGVKNKGTVKSNGFQALYKTQIQNAARLLVGMGETDQLKHEQCTKWVVIVVVFLLMLLPVRL